MINKEQINTFGVRFTLKLKKNNFSHQKGSRQYILVYNSNIQLLYDTTLLNFLFQFGSFWL